MNKRVVLVSFLVLLCAYTNAQLNLTLEACRDMALSSNTSAQIDKENEQALMYMRKSMLARFFPQFSANGMYSYQSDHIRIVPNTLYTDWGSIGTGGLNINTPFGQAFNMLLPDLSNAISDMAGNAYTNVYDRFDLNTNHVVAGQVGVVQPIFLGGKIRETYRIARSMENINKMKSAKNNADLIVSVDEAYWRVVSVAEKKKLATQYTDLLTRLENDVTTAMEEGVATRADLLSVRVKKNEAEASLAQATDGLELSKMALCQLIGLPLSTDIQLDQHGLDSLLIADGSVDIDAVLAQRKEIQMLEEAEKVAHSSVKLAASTLQPNIIATANYVITNPNVSNSFANSFSGMWQAGVVVNIPIAHASDILMVKAAKHKANTINLQLQEAKEKIELQATQSAQKVLEANKKLIRANTALENAEENLHYAEESYNEGVVTASTLMMAQTAWQKAYTDKIDAAIELRMAEITLRNHTGSL